MEALLFILDSVVLVAMVYWGLRDDRRAAGQPQVSLFRFVDDAAAAAAARKLRRQSPNTAGRVDASGRQVAAPVGPRPLSPSAQRRADAIRRRAGG